jgi:DNA-directed RNA polymerase specialized sigma24 family protein
MWVDPLTLAAARAGKKDALVRILALHYPRAWRMAVNLTGREETGKRVATSIMRQSLAAAATWEHEEAPARWFGHHTVLATREAAPAEPPADDVLILHGPPESAYAAFARAVRSLPQQQREAFLLNHGEDFDLRQLGIAMDCSVEAAGVHLRHATLTLQSLAGAEFGRFVELLRQAYAASAPEESLALPYADKLIRPRFWSLVLLVGGWMALLGIVGAIAWGLWWLWPRLIT